MDKYQEYERRERRQAALQRQLNRLAKKIQKLEAAEFAIKDELRKVKEQELALMEKSNEETRLLYEENLLLYGE